MTSPSDSRPLEIWAGVEGTVNRVGDHYMDQCALNGHDLRPNDLEMIASLGLRRIRYPLVWEKVETQPGVYDWSRADRSLAEFQRLNIDPIVGLLHHGSGPRWTSLVDADFATSFARYARAFADRYPWITQYTPINEPLTTARFSCLYGVWYPHDRSDRAFVSAVVNQVKATSLAMKEIRRVQPAAILLQTEDLGKTSGTPPLQYQVDFENHRRWLTFDLLCGRVDDRHPLADYLNKNGLKSKDRDWILRHGCAPDIMGINHYVLSNRYLDHQLDNYPHDLHGGNGTHRYVDVGAAHFAKKINPSLESVLREVAARYPHRDFAVTEAHLDGPRESQMRWLADVWHQCETLKSEGLPIRAVTAWSLLGTYNWNSLCTRNDNYYESGVFDVRTTPIRPTALARMLRTLTSRSTLRHEPVLSRAGWWQQHRGRSGLGKNPAPILIIGAGPSSGPFMASSIQTVCEARGLNAVCLEDLDLEDTRAIVDVIADLKPWAVMCAAVPSLLRDDIDTTCTFKSLALACRQNKTRFVMFSDDDPAQDDTERDVLAVAPEALVVRIDGPLRASDAVDAVLDVLIDHESGVVELSAQGTLRRIALDERDLRVPSLPHLRRHRLANSMMMERDR